MQDAASLQSLPAPFGPPLGCLVFLPKSPVYKLADTGRRGRLELKTGNSQPPFGARQVTKPRRRSQGRAGRFAASVLHPGHLGSPPSPSPSPFPPNTAHPALRWPQGKSSIRNPFFPPEGSHRLRPSLPFGAPRVPQLQGLSTAPKRRPARPGRWSPPALSGSPLHLTGARVTAPGSGMSRFLPGVSGQSPARPVGSGFARSCPAPGAPVSLRPLPQLPVPGERERARWARLAPPSPSGPGDGGGGGRRGLPGRSAGEGVEVLWVGPCAPGTPHPPLGFGAGSPAPFPLASEPRPGGAAGRPESRGPGRLTPAGQWRSPLSALRSRRRRRIGRSPPTLTPGEGAERANGGPRQPPRPRPGASPGPRLAAAARPPPPGPAWGRSRRGLVPKGDRSRARSRPPGSPAAPRRRPAPPRRRRAAFRGPAGGARGSPAGCGASRGPPGSRSGAAAAARFLRSPPPYWYL